MSSKALGLRLGMTAQGVRNLEKGEANGTLSLNTLARLANGLDCDVQYMFVPRTSLVEQVIRQTHDASGIEISETYKVTELFRDTEALNALSVVLAQVNKRGLW